MENGQHLFDLLNSNESDSETDASGLPAASKTIDLTVFPARDRDATVPSHQLTNRLQHLLKDIQNAKVLVLVDEAFGADAAYQSMIKAINEQMGAASGKNIILDVRYGKPEDLVRLGRRLCPSCVHWIIRPSEPAARI
jgi:hypothetical protein